MTPKKSTGAEIPTLKLLAGLATEGEYDSVLRGLCMRADARVAALFMRAVATVDFVTDSPKASGWLAESHGAMEAGELPDDPPVLIQALIDRAILHRPGKTFEKHLRVCPERVDDHGSDKAPQCRTCLGTGFVA